VRRFEGHTYEVKLVTFSRDGKWIVSFSDDKTVRVWCSPVPAFHTRTVSYREALTIHSPSLENAADNTQPMCPRRILRSKFLVYSFATMETV
jgi:WD40 repeat protein